LKNEIEKCQILCANCHLRKTANDFNWYKEFR
jgi:5-methylcytosine-specific restriction endonuclease McrA